MRCPRIPHEWLKTATVSAMVILCTLLLLSRPAPARGQTSTIERVLPATQAVAVGDTVSIDVTVENVNHLGAFEAVIAYDSSLLTFSSASNGPFIGSSGRTVFCPPPAMNVISGSIRQLRFGCVTSGNSPPGPSGDGLLATIAWIPAGPGDATLSLTPSLSDELGTDIPATGFSGVVHITTGPTDTPTATNTPCPVACPTDTPTPTPTDTPTSTATPTMLCSGTLTIVCVSPAGETVGRGTTFEVGVAVSQVTGLAAFQFTLAYDPALVTAIGAVPGPFLSSTGRAVQCLGPALTPGSLQFTCVTLAEAPAPPSGSGIVAIVRFSADLEGTTNIDLSSVGLAGLAGNIIATDIASGSRTIGPCSGLCPTATATPTSTKTATATATATPTGTATPCPGACPTATATDTPSVTSTIAPTSTAGSPGPVTLQMIAPSQDVLQGAGFLVDVTADGVTDLGAYEVGITYDASLLTLVSAQNGTLLGSTGRSVSCPSSSAGIGSVRLACITLGSEPAGPNGSGLLARFAFTATAPGISSIAIASPVLVDRFGDILPVSSTSPGSVTIVPCGGPCPTATATPAVSTATATPAGGSAIISVEPPSLTANVGDTFAVQAQLANGTNVGTYDVLLDYAYDDSGAFEPNVLEFMDTTGGDFLGSTGRPVTCLPPIVDLVSVRIGCVTTGPTPAGPNGGGLLATLHFRVLKTSLRPMILRVDASSGGTSDPDGVPQPFSPGGSTTITIAAPTGSIAAPMLITGQDGGGHLGTMAKAGRSALRGLLRSHREGGADMLAALVLTFASVAAATRRRRGLRASAVAAVTGACVLVLAVAPSGHRDALATSPIQVFASPISVNAFEGGGPTELDVNITSASAPGLASFELQATFNATLISASVSEGPFLGRSGNATACVTDYPSTSQIRLSCSATGAPQSGPTGSGVLAVFLVKPRASLDMRATNATPIVTALDLSDVIVRTSDGVASSIAASPGSVIAVRPLQGDVNHDCVVNVADDELIASHYYRHLSTPGYASALDVEPALSDGDIDLSDVQFVLGRTGSTCGVPSPPQAPPALQPPDNLDTDGDGCSNAKELMLVPPTDPNNPWDFYSVPVPALFAAQSPATVFRDLAVGAGDAQAVFAYFKAGAHTGATVYEQDLNNNGIKDGVEYDRTVVGPGKSGPPDGTVSAQDAQLAFAQFKKAYHC